MRDVPVPDRPNPLVRGERVYLRAIEPGDADLVHRWYAHADSARLMGEWPRSLARRRQDAETAVRESGRDWFAFIICRLEDDEPIGIGEWERPQQDRVNNVEHPRHGADGEGQGQYGRREEPGRASKRSGGMTQIGGPGREHGRLPLVICCLDAELNPVVRGTWA